VYRIVLTGETDTPPDLRRLYANLSEMFFELQLRDETRMRRSVWEAAGQDTLRGLFLRKLKGRYDAAEEQDKKVCVLNMSARPGHVGSDEIRHGKYSHRADPVDRADRPVQKAPVHDHAHAERVIEDLDDPASDRIDCKIHKDLIPCHSEYHFFLRECFLFIVAQNNFHTRDRFLPLLQTIPGYAIIMFYTKGGTHDRRESLSGSA
jgi:hypothetical protein